MILVRLLFGALFLCFLGSHAWAQTACPIPNPNASAWTTLTGPPFKGLDSVPSVSCSLPAAGLNGAFSTLATAISAGACPQGWTCISPTNTIADETTLTNAIGSGGKNVLMLPGKWDICTGINVPALTNISGLVWSNDDPVSNAMNINLALTPITCNDGTFSRFSALTGFFTIRNASNISIQNLQFYGSWYHGISGGNDACIAEIAGAGQTTSAITVAHNSMMGCHYGLNADGFSGGLSQDSPFFDNIVYQNYAGGYVCTGCSDIIMERNHFGDNGLIANTYDVDINGCCGRINNNRFEFQGGGIVIRAGANSIVMTGNDFDKVLYCLTLDPASGGLISDIAFVGNRCTLNGTDSTTAAITVFDGGGANTAFKLSQIYLSGNILTGGTTGAAAYHIDPGLNILTTQFLDLPGLSIYDNAVTKRMLSAFVGSSGVGAAGDNSTVNWINFDPATATNLTETFASDIPSSNPQGAELLTETTAAGTHQIATPAGFSNNYFYGGYGVNIPYVFDALIKAGSTSRNLEFLWNDAVVTNQIGIIFTPSSCTSTGTSVNALGTGSVVGSSQVLVNGGTWCHVRATLSLGASNTSTGAQNIIALCTSTTAGSCSYTGTTGSVILENPTFKVCTQVSGTPC